MSRSAKTFRILAASLAATLPVGVSPAPAASQAPRAVPASSPLEGWTLLRLEGRKFLFATGRSEIARHGGVCEDGRELVSVSSRARVFGARAGEHLAVSVVDAAEDSSIVFMERSGEKRARLGVVAGTPPRVSIATFRPRPDGPPASIEEWPEADRAEYGLAEHDGPGPLDAYALLARLDVLVRAGEGTVQLLTKSGPTILGFRTLESRKETLKIRNLADGDGFRGEADIVVLDLFPGGSGEGETVLNMSGTTRLWIDAASGALVRIEGEHQSAGGRLTMKLSGARRDPVGVPGFHWPGEAERSTCGDPAPAEPTLDAQDGAS